MEQEKTVVNHFVQFFGDAEHLEAAKIEVFMGRYDDVNPCSYCGSYNSCDCEKIRDAESRENWNAEQQAKREAKQAKREAEQAKWEAEQEKWKADHPTLALLIAIFCYGIILILLIYIILFFALK